MQADKQRAGPVKPDAKRSGSAKPTPAKPIPAKPATAARLERVALHYLERYAASEAMVRQVLLRRVDRAVAAGLTEVEAGRAAVVDVIAKLHRLGYLNDAAFARMRAASLSRRGKSPRAVRETLRQKGVDPDMIEDALGDLAQDAGGDDAASGESALALAAAIALARRRRLGPFRAPSLNPHTEGGRQETPEQRRTRDLAALARAGFPFDIARQVIDGDREILEQAVTRL